MFYHLAEVGEHINHISETSYVIDFDRAMNSLSTYANAQYSKSTEGENKSTQITGDESSINVVCTEKK